MAIHRADPLATRSEKALVETAVPLLSAVSELDPPRFQVKWAGLLAARLERHGRLPASFFGRGHNHFSMAHHLGSGETRLADAVADFVNDLTPLEPDHDRSPNSACR